MDFEFFDSEGNRIDHLHSEHEEQELARLHVPEDSQGVLELGARYGTVTAQISKKISRRPVFITVEPDPTVWQALEKNIQSTGTVAFLVKGVISRKPKKFHFAGYSGNIHDQPSDCTSIPCPTWTLEEVQEFFKIPVIDTLVADCEGALEEFLFENPGLFESLRVIIFEADFPKVCNYAKIYWHLNKHGFKEIVRGFQNVWKKPEPTLS